MVAELTAGRVTARALADAALARIAADDGNIHAFITVDAARAVRAADASDKRRANGQIRGPLDGVPVAVKDNIAVSGLPCTAGTRRPLLAPEHDATVVARLRAAGAVIIGTLNMHEGALGATTDNPFWGRCDNPAAPGHTPGGSSGGSAAAIAVGYVPITLGTDTMGSVRIPAAYCGLWGLKPTRGVIPVTGLVHLSWTLDTIGPLSATADDLELALDVLAGFDSADPISVAAAVDALPPLQDAAIGVLGDAILTTCEPAVRAAYETAIAAAQSAGARIVPFPLEWNPGKLRRAGLLISEAEGAVTLGDAMARDPGGFSEGFRAAIDYGANAPAPKLAAAYRLVAEAASLTARAMTAIDAVLLPTAPQRAFPHGALVPADQADFTALANITGLPALSVPLPATDGGPPCAVQLLGHPFADKGLIALGKTLQERITA